MVAAVEQLLGLVGGTGHVVKYHLTEKMRSVVDDAMDAIEREVRLNNWIKKGVHLDAEITALTIESIFTVPGPLHDGAVIISQDKIAAAAVILPITEREELGYVLGTRHRAAIGISEQSDAIVIVVSEETRAISLVFEGEIKRGWMNRAEPTFDASLRHIAQFDFERAVFGHAAPMQSGATQAFKRFAASLD